MPIDIHVLGLTGGTGCNRSDSIEEWELDQPEGKEVECLLDRLKLHFSSGHKEELSDSAKEKQRQVGRHIILLGASATFRIPLWVQGIRLAIDVIIDPGFFY